MNYPTIGSVLCIAVAAVLIVVVEIRRGRRYIVRRLDAHAEALRMIAQMVRVEIPPEPKPPQRPDLRVVKSVAAAVALSGAMFEWSSRHARIVSASAVALGIGLVVLLAQGGAPRRPATAQPSRPPIGSSVPPASTAPGTHPPSTIPDAPSSSPPATTPLATSAPPTFTGVVPIAGVVAPRRSALPSPSSPQPRPSSPRPSPSQTAAVSSSPSTRPTPVPSPTDTCLVSAEAKLLSVGLGLCI